MTLTVFNDLEQGSDEWLQARAGILTASTVGKLLTSTGKVANNDTSRALTETLIAERITGRVEYVYPTRDMQRGTILEPFARALYAEHYAPVDEVGFIRLDTDTFTLGYSPDGLVGDDGLIEIKSRRARAQIHALTHDQVPAYNMAQLQAGLLVTGRDWIDYVSYSPGLPLYVKRIAPDRKWFASIVDACEEYAMAADKYLTDYTLMSAPYHPTEWFDPFEEEEIY